MKASKLILLFLIVAAALLFGLSYFQEYQARKRIEAIRAELRAEGEPSCIEDLSGPEPEPERNAYPALEALQGRLQAERERTPPPGMERERLEDFSEEELAALSAYIEERSWYFDSLAEALARPSLWSNTARLESMTAAWGMPPDELQRAVEFPTSPDGVLVYLAEWTSLSIAIDAATQRPRALERLERLFALGRLHDVPGQHVVVRQLAIHRAILLALGRLLEFPAADAQAIHARFGARLKDLELVFDWVEILRAERAIFLSLFERLGEQREPRRELMILELVQDILKNLRAGEVPRKLFEEKGFIPRSFFLHVDRMNSRVRLVRLGLAARRHREQQGRWPEKLEELAGLLDGGVPADPLTGESFLLETRGEGLAIRSRWDDGDPEKDLVPTLELRVEEKAR